MTQKTWFALVVAVSLLATAAISFAPRQGATAKSEVQECGENAVPVYSPRGHVACSLKNGKVIYLRSPK